MDSDRLHRYLAAFRNKRLLVVGDVMLDCFIWGNVTRISPEAPVPVVEVQSETSYPGGAANVARNLRPFCDHVSVAGLTGVDPLAAELDALLKDGGIETAGLLRDGSYQTIVKTRIIARGQQVVRIDHEKRKAIDDRLLESVLEFIGARLPEVDAMIIEDYGKGFVTQALVDGVAAAAREAGVLVTADPNPTNPLEWDGVTAVKPNRSEAFQAAGMNEASLRSPGDLATILDQLGTRLFSRWQIEMLLVTLSEQGMALLERDAPPYLLPTRAREVFDVSGAGDTAIALFTLALCAGASPREAAEISNHAAGVVVGKVGTAILSPEELADAFADSQE